MSNTAQTNSQHNEEPALIPESAIFDSASSQARTKLSDEASTKLSSPVEGKQIGDGIQQINSQRFNITVTESVNKDAFSKSEDSKPPIINKTNDDQVLNEKTKSSNQTSPPFAQPIFDANGKFTHFEIKPDDKDRITKPDQTDK